MPFSDGSPLHIKNISLLFEIVFIVLFSLRLLIVFHDKAAQRHRAAG